MNCHSVDLTVCPNDKLPFSHFSQFVIVISHVIAIIVNVVVVVVAIVGVVGVWFPSVIIFLVHYSTRLMAVAVQLTNGLY